MTQRKLGARKYQDFFTPRQDQPQPCQELSQASLLNAHNEFPF